MRDTWRLPAWILAFMTLLAGAGSARAQAPTDSRPAFVPLLSQAEAWKSLPRLEEGKPGRLPRWALATAKALPRTTAAVLELEERQRTLSPLEPSLRGKIRLVVAHANECAYSQAQARADLERLGASPADIQALLAPDAGLPPVLAFARKLTLAAYTVTDAEVARLEQTLGAKQLVAVVQLTAFANFQDRLILALGVAAEPEGPPPPAPYRFSKEMTAQPRPQWPTAPGRASPPLDPEWTALSFKTLKQEMAKQQERQPRVPVPKWEEVKELLPPESRKRELRIKWSLVCLGYQPELALGWSACTRAFATEAELDRVFEESLFWVVTRTLQCFY